jgi:hypothetical protein
MFLLSFNQLYPKVLVDADPGRRQTDTIYSEADFSDNNFGDTLPQGRMR